MKNKNKCILCNLKNTLKVYLDLGKSPLANNLEKISNKKVEKYPLRLAKCSKCGHIQLDYLASPKKMFNNYLYLSSASTTLTNHLSSIPLAINKKRKIKKNDIVIDIGSNDATLLKGYKSFGAKCIGVEPAKNLRKYYKKNNIELINNFFSNKIAKKIKNDYGKAKFLTATNVFPHLQNLKEFCHSIHTILDENGIVLIEAHYFGQLIKDVAFDTIYHEHASYWTVSSVNKLFKKYDLNLFHVDFLNIHHGQIRCWVTKNNKFKKSKRLIYYLNQEKKIKLHGDKKLRNFAKEVKLIKIKINNFFEKCNKTGVNVVGYGAPAKATTIINYLELSNNKLKFIVDKNPLKHKKYIPGTNIQILGPENVDVKKFKYLFNFAWNFINEILNQQKKFMKLGGKILNPIPKFKIF